MAPQAILKRLITEELNEPVVFNDMITDWQASSWSPEVFGEIAGDMKIKFRIGVKENKREGALWESDCLFEEGTMDDFIAWINWTCTDSNPLKKYPADDHWIYADYKYMAHMFREKPEVLMAVKWDNFGFLGRDGEASTLWIGSPGAHTPCHYDTYGCNLVAQIYGRKRWFLYPPSMTDQLYPTRIPYEESSVFSLVDVKQPNLTENPFFKGTTPWVVTLEPGQVLLVPKHWWHFVESLETSISINSWIELESDNKERLSESVCRLLISSLMSSNTSTSIEEEDWLNPTEENHSGEVNLAYLEEAFRVVEGKEEKVGNTQKRPVSESQEQTEVKRICTEMKKNSAEVEEVTNSSETELSESRGKFDEYSAPENELCSDCTITSKCIQGQKNEINCYCELCKTVGECRKDEIKPHVKHLEPISFKQYLKDYVPETISKDSDGEVCENSSSGQEKSLDRSKDSAIDKVSSDQDSESDYESFNESLLKNNPSHLLTRFVRAVTHPDIVQAIVGKFRSDTM